MIAVLAVTLAPAPAASGHTPATSPDFFGVNAPFLRQLAFPDRPELVSRMDAAAASMGRAGISWARVTFDQSVEERQRGVFDWTVPDMMVAALARHGVRTTPMFVGTAPWADNPGTLLNNCGPRAYPHDVQAWANWVAAAARRYGTNGTFWAANPGLPRLPIRTMEIGNEPNLSIFWCPRADPEGYAVFYSAAADTVAAVDPGARVTVGGLAPNWGTPRTADVAADSFLARMVASKPSLRSSIPAVGIHPYVRTSDGVDGGLDMIVRFRQSMTAAGMPTTPMLADEFGWYTQPQSGLYFAAESQRVGLIGGTANTFWRTNCGVSGMAPFSWVTAEINKYDPQNWFGLASTWTGQPHPSGAAYAQQISIALGLASSPPPASTLALCPESAPQPIPSSSPNPSPPPLLPNLLRASDSSAAQSASQTRCQYKKAKKNARKKRKRRRC